MLVEKPCLLRDITVMPGSGSKASVIAVSSTLLRANDESPLARHLRTGQEHYACGRTIEAIENYQAALAVAASEPPENVAVELLADIHARLANAFMAGGQLGSAAENYKAALRLMPSLAACWCNLGNVQLQMGEAQQAISLYLEALKLNPGHWPSRTNLVQALMATKQHLIAKALLLELIDERPRDGRLLHDLGKACFALTEPDQALQHFEEAVAINSGDADSLYWIGGLNQSLGRPDAAQAAYLRAAQLQPLIRRPAAKSPADFRILALYAPFGGNMPTEFLFGNASYETNTLALLTSSKVDADRLKYGIDAVVNLISDADQALDVLPIAADLAKQLGKPTINDPDKILRTTRDAIAELLQGIPGCRVPGIVRLRAAPDRSAAMREAALILPLPVLARPAGTHGGDDFEKFDDRAGLANFLAERPGDDCYLIEYIDYRSVDGHFRKYRFIFVGADILPYHLAIGSDWKLHHDSTDMGAHPWMQREELTFLSGPDRFFSERNYQALRTIRDRIGLDFFGIDCALDASGDLVVFEVNASMLVHDQNADFPYKGPFVRDIKLAFDAMLQRRAAEPRGSSAPVG
jgi:tetratricopeptide (TPR) repeat protein